jgi:dTMP kinase
MAGKFIVFEGIDSDVIVDQAGRLAGWLRSEGLRSVTTREPTDGPIGAQIRLVLNDRLQVDELTLAALFLADRVDHLYRKGDGILYLLKQDQQVVCVRYLLSAYAYQNEVVELEWLKQINQPCSWPDLMIFIDTPVQSCLDRFIRQRGFDDRQAQEKERELAEQRRNYLRAIEQCRSDGQEVHVADGNQPSATIHRACRDLVERLGLER